MLNKILSPLDGSALSKCSLDHVKEIARERKGAEVVLMTVLKYELPFWDESFTESKAKEFYRDQQEKEKQIRQKAEEYLAEVAGDLKKEGLAVKTVIVQARESEGVADLILDYADKNKIELIVISTHGRSGISRWAMGSVADRIVTRAKAPVLTITPAGCRL